MRGFPTAATCSLILGCCLSVQGAARADAVTASPAELAAVTAWAADVFGGPAAGSFPPAPVEFLLKQQDFSELHFRSSCIDTPICIGA